MKIRKTIRIRPERLEELLYIQAYIQSGTGWSTVSMSETIEKLIFDAYIELKEKTIDVAVTSE